MRRAIPTVLVACGCLRLAAAQAGQNLQFEVASVKPSLPPAGRMPATPRLRGGPGSSDPARISYTNVPLALLPTMAFEVNGADAVGPAWTKSMDLMGSTDKFDIEATLPAGTTREQFFLMWQRLLAERFELKIHREKKEMPAYALVPAKNGPKLTEAPPADAGAAAKVDVRVTGEDGFPVTPAGYSGLFVHVKSGHTRVKFIGSTMDQFARWTRKQTKRPGVDRTGVAGRYDFYLEFGNQIGVPKTAGADAPPEPADQGEGFAVALGTQPGLKLVPDKAEVELLVIDHMNRTPSGN